MKIANLKALEILDSRGNPTVEVSLQLECGSSASAMVPSGASTGEHEAVELRDVQAKRYGGKGVLKAVENVNTVIGPALIGREFDTQQTLDYLLLELDGTPNKKVLGANALLGVSMAFARASALANRMPLFHYLGRADSYLLPVPCMNVINGGRHADNNVDFQEFMIAPHRATTFSESIQMGIEVFHALKSVLHQKGYSTGVGDEGGFAPDLKSNEQAIEFILEAIVKAGYKPGADVGICLDPATSEMWEDGYYRFFKSTQKRIKSSEMVQMWESWVRQYPILSIEDGLAENDWDGWREMTDTLGGKIELVGDDLFCTNKQILAQGIERGVANAILIKLNQIGTVTETLETIELARNNGYHNFISHRSGETVDTFIADLAVATRAGHIKTGSGCRGERVEKFNQLLRIEQLLGTKASFAGVAAFKNSSPM